MTESPIARPERRGGRNRAGATRRGARRSAERAGAEVAVLQGLGHWWMCQDPKAGAAALEDFFNRLG